MLRLLSCHFRDGKTINSLRFVRETALARREDLWSAFEGLLKNARSVLSSLSIDHCCLTDSHCDKLRLILAPEAEVTPSSTFKSPVSCSIKNLTVREPHASWRCMSDLFSTALSCSQMQNSVRPIFLPAFPKLQYFSTLVPRMSEISQWQSFILSSDQYCDEMSTKSDPRVFYGRKLEAMAREKGRKVKIDLCWEPELDWT